MAAATKSFDLWIDFGATIDVYNKKLLFSYEEEENGYVLMGNYVFAKVLGKGSVELQFTFEKKLILKNVLHVSKIKKNFISTNILCKNGLKVILEFENCIMSKNRLLLENGIYMMGYSNLVFQSIK